MKTFVRSIANTSVQVYNLCHFYALPPGYAKAIFFLLASLLSFSPKFLSWFSWFLYSRTWTRTWNYYFVPFSIRALCGKLSALASDLICFHIENTSNFICHGSNYFKVPSESWKCERKVIRSAANDCHLYLKMKCTPLLTAFIYFYGNTLNQDLQAQRVSAITTKRSKVPFPKRIMAISVSAEIWKANATIGSLLLSTQQQSFIKNKVFITQNFKNYVFLKLRLKSFF